MLDRFSIRILTRELKFNITFKLIFHVFPMLLSNTTCTLCAPWWYCKIYIINRRKVKIQHIESKDINIIIENFFTHSMHLRIIKIIKNFSLETKIIKRSNMRKGFLLLISFFSVFLVLMKNFSNLKDFYDTLFYAFWDVFPTFV